jgi:AsmA protein
LKKNNQGIQNMKRLVKIVGVMVVIIVAAIFAVLVAAKILITPERVRQVVIPIAEEQLKRPVSIGDIRVRIFSGIVLSDFVIGSKENSEDFVSAENLVLRYRFWPLLRLSVVVDEARLDSPEIWIERYENGEFNFSDLLAEKATGKDESTENSGVQADETGDGRTIDLLVNQISISKGRLIFMDRMVNREFQLTDLSVSVSDFSLNRSFPFNLSAEINGSPLDLAGIINPETTDVTSQIQVKDLDLAAFMPYASDKFPGKLSSLKLSMDINAKATNQTVDSSGKITLNDIGLLMDDMPDIPVENARVTLDYDIGVDLASEKLIIEKADADINGILLSASGSVLSYATAPVLDITARMPMISLPDVMASVPQKLVESMSEMRPAGRIGAEIYVKGSPDKPEELIEKGEINLEKISFTINKLAPEISGDINIAKDTAVSDNIVMNLAGDRVDMDFEANNLMGKKIVINNTIRSDKLNIDKILSALEVKDQEPGPPADKTPDTHEEPGPFDFPLQAKGDVKVADAIFQGLPVTDFNLQYLLKDNVLTINRIYGNVAGGTISGSAEARLNRKPIAYNADISVKETRAENILNNLFPAAANSVFGTLFLNANIKGEGTSWDVIKQKLTSHADVNVIDGRLTGTGFAGGLAGFLNSGSLEVLEFESLKGNLKLEDGKIKLNSQFTGERVRMAPVGDIGLDGSLDLSLSLRLAPQIASQIKMGELYSQFAQSQDGWTIVPLKVAGAVNSPSFNLDTSTVSEQLKEKGKEEFKKQLQEKVLDRLTPKSSEKTAEEADKQEKAAPDKKLEDTLRKLFN